MVYLVVRMKGTVNVPSWAQLTLENLHLDKKFRATLVPENKQTLGMLRKIKDIVSWTSVDEGFVKEFIEKKGRVSATRLISASSTDEKVETTPKLNLNNIVSSILKNEEYLSKISGIKPWFALNPPKGGFKKKSKLQHSQNGILGENRELVDLVKRMM